MKVNLTVGLNAVDVSDYFDFDFHQSWHNMTFLKQNLFAQPTVPKNNIFTSWLNVQLVFHVKGD